MANFPSPVDIVSPATPDSSLFYDYIIILHTSLEQSQIVDRTEKDVLVPHLTVSHAPRHAHQLL